MRQHPWLEECQVAPEIFDQGMPHLPTFLAPWVATFQGPALTPPATTSVRGRRSDVERHNVASIASHAGPDRLGLQGCSGWADGADAPLRQAVLGHVGKPWGHAEGVVGCDPAALPTSGRASVGVARQWGGRLGKVDTCHVAISVGDVARQGHTLGALRRSLPQAWTQEQTRWDQAGVPKARRGYRPRHQWAVEIREKTGAARPHRGIAGDDALGRPAWLRRRRAAVGER